MNSYDEGEGEFHLAYEEVLFFPSRVSSFQEFFLLAVLVIGWIQFSFLGIDSLFYKVLRQQRSLYQNENYSTIPQMISFARLAQLYL